MINKITESLERLCKESDKLVKHELIWHALRICEEASLGADAAYEALKGLSVEARAKLADALRDMLDNQPGALKAGYVSLQSVSGSGPLANVSHAWRTSPAEWLQLIERLGQGHPSSGMIDGNRVIKRETRVSLFSDDEE